MNIPLIKIGNKVDKADMTLLKELGREDFIFISATKGTNLPALQEKILSRFHVDRVKQGDVVITNVRHFQSLQDTHAALERVLKGMENGVTGDFLAMDVRNALHHLGIITGEISTDDLLANIFGKFCIGK